MAPKRLLSLIRRIAPVLLLGGLVACGTGDDDTEPTAQEPHKEVLEISIASSDQLAFEPAEIRVPVGERVRLVLNNGESGALHDIVVADIPVGGVEEQSASADGHGDHADDEQQASTNGLHVAAEAGQQGSVEFVPTEPGEYPFHCSVPGHESGGMAGRLVVE